MVPIPNIQKFLTLAFVSGLAGACATSTQGPSGSTASSEPAKPLTTEPPKVAPVLVEYRSKVVDAPLTRIGVSLDGDATIGKAGPLGAGEHKISILVELSPADGKPIAYQREFVVRLGEPKYVKVLVAITAAPSHSADGFSVDTQLQVMEEPRVPQFSLPAATRAEQRKLEARPPVIDPRLIVDGVVLDDLVQICVDAQGKIESETLVAPSSTLFDAAIIRAVWHWRFQPLVEAGNAKAFCYVQRNSLKVSQ